MFRDLVLRDDHLIRNGQAVIFHGETLLREVCHTRKYNPCCMRLRPILWFAYRGIYT